MLTPAIRESRTSFPSVMSLKAVSTHVMVPPFLNWWPFPEATTTGRAVRTITLGAWPNALVEASKPAAVPATTKSRRFSFSDMCELLQTQDVGSLLLNAYCTTSCPKETAGWGRATIEQEHLPAI